MVPNLFFLLLPSPLAHGLNFLNFKSAVKGQLFGPPVTFAAAEVTAELNFILSE